MAKIETGTADIVRVIYPVQENPKLTDTIVIGEPEIGTISCTTIGDIKRLYTGQIAKDDSGFVTGEKVALSLETKANAVAVNAALEEKVDKVAGAGLMTDAERTKLSGIAIGANAYTLPIATPETLGGIKVGANLTISDDGVLTATSGENDSVVIDLTDRHGVDGNEKVKSAVQAALPALMASKSKTCTLLLSKDNGLHCPYCVVSDTYLHMAVAYNSDTYEPQNPPYTTFTLWVLEAFIKDGIVERASFSANSLELPTRSGMYESLNSYMPIVYENSYESRVGECYWKNDNGENLQVYQRTFTGTITQNLVLLEGISRAFLESGDIHGFPPGYQVANDNSHLWNYAVIDNKLCLTLYDETASQLIGSKYNLTFRYIKA